MGKKITMITTDIAEDNFWESTVIESGVFDENNKLNVYDKYKGRIHKGFGGAFTETSGYNWMKLPAEKQLSFIQSYFGEDGLCYNLGRTHINSCDFALGNYACVEDPNDEILESFTAQRDEEYILPLIEATEKELGEKISLMLSPWSPPAFMKTNGSMNGGGALKEEYYDRWAKCFAKYVKYYVDRDIQIDMITVQNEPEAPSDWDSCLYTSEEEAKFLTDYLKPEMVAIGLQDIQIYAWDYCKDRFVDRVEEYMVNEQFLNAVDGFAVHWYSGDHFDAVQLVADKYPDKDILFTEGCVEYFKYNDTSKITNAEMYAHDIIGNFKAGVQGHIDWNLLLDAEGGTNHVGNYCEAPIMLNDTNDDYIKNASYYYIGHFSRYIKPGAVNLKSSSYTSDVELVSFENPDKSIVSVILNRTNMERKVCYSLKGEVYTFQCKAHTIVTLIN